MPRKSRSKVSLPALFEICDAVREGQVEEFGANRPVLHATTPAGLSPLWYAVRWQMPQITEVLVGEFDVPVDLELLGRPSLLDLANSLPNQEIAELLKSADAEVKPAEQLKSEREAGHPRWPTMLHFTEEELPFYDAVTADEHPAIQQEREKLDALTREKLFLEACFEDEPQIVAALMPTIKNLNYVGPMNKVGGGPPLITAIERGNLEVTKLLLEEISNRGKPRSELHSHLDLAAEMGQEHIVDYLLELGFEPQWPQGVDHTMKSLIDRRYAGIVHKLVTFVGSNKQDKYLQSLEKQVKKFGEQTIPFWLSGECEE